MEDIFKAVTAQLKTVPALKWIDEDKGQLNYERPPVLFPCALIDITVTGTKDLNKRTQQCEAVITVRLAWDFTGPTNSKAPEVEVQKSLKYYRDAEAVRKALQGWGGANFNELSRKGFYQEKRPDSYKVVAIPFTTSFIEDNS